MKILITGATGFIGSHLSHKLVAEGHEIIALVRNPKKVSALPNKNVELLEGDLSLFKNPNLKLPSCDCVVHLAAVVAAPKMKDYNSINYEAVIDLIECLKRQSWQPKQLLFASSVAATGPSQKDKPRVESDIPNPIDAYGLAKLKAEEYAQTAPFPVVSFRPGAVYGPGDPAFLTLFKMAKKGLGFKVWGHKQLISYIYVDDLIDAILKMTLKPANTHKSYYVTHPEPMDTDELWHEFRKIFGRKIIVPAFPKPILYLAMLIGTGLAKIFRFTNQLDRKQYKQLVAPSWVCSSEALMKDYHWQPKHDLKSSLTLTIDGYRKSGWL